jgi:hypothetical protein
MVNRGSVAAQQQDQARRPMMAAEVARIDVWFGEIEDRSGGLAEKIEAVSAAGANLEFVISRRAPDRPGMGVVFMAPLRGAAQIRAARQAGLAKASNVYAVRLEGPNQPGFGAAITRSIADAGINMRGLSGTALGRRCAIYLAFDSNEDANKASRILRKTLQGR